jgi:hypothetical protein
MPRDTLTGSTIVVAIIGNSGTDQISGISISAGSATFTKIATASGLIGGDALSYVTIWYAYNITGGTTPTITITKAASWAIQAIAWEVVGLTTTDPLDVVAGAGAAATTAVNSGATASTAQASEYLIGIGGSDFGGATYSHVAGSYFDNLTQVSAAAGDIAMADREVNAVSTYTATLTLSGATDNRGAILAFKNLVGGSATPSVAWLRA